MWWKLSMLLILTAALIFCVIPIRTHAVMIDPAKPPQATKWTLSLIVSNMYLTPGTLGIIGVLVAVASYIAFWITRSS